MDIIIIIIIYNSIGIKVQFYNIIVTVCNRKGLILSHTFFVWIFRPPDNGHTALLIHVVVWEINEHIVLKICVIQDLYLKTNSLNTTE